MSRFKLNWIGLVAILMLVGCGGGADGDGYDGARGQVAGKITFEGKPIPEGSQVYFQATDGYAATGTVKAGGEYTLQYPKGDLLPAVAYKVQVTPPLPATQAPMNPADIGKSKIPKETDSSPFPAKYGSTASSKLEFTVKEGKNSIDIVLTK